MESIYISAMAWISDLVGPMLGADPSDLVGPTLGAGPNEGMGPTLGAGPNERVVGEGGTAVNSSCREVVRANSPHMWGSGPNSGSYEDTRGGGRCRG